MGHSMDANIAFSLVLACRPVQYYITHSESLLFLFILLVHTVSSPPCPPDFSDQLASHWPWTFFLLLHSIYSIILDSSKLELEIFSHMVIVLPDNVFIPQERLGQNRIP